MEVIKMPWRYVAPDIYEVSAETEALVADSALEMVEEGDEWNWEV